MTTYRHIAIIGRIRNDDEEEIEMYENCTLNDARSHFKDSVACLMQTPNPKNVQISHVITSDSPILVTSYV